MSCGKKQCKNGGPCSSQNRDVGIAQDAIVFVGKQLPLLQADAYLIYTQLLQFHWNVKGPLFSTLHSFFQEGYELTFSIIDEISERIAQLGFVVPGTMKAFLEKTRLSEEESEQEEEVMLAIIQKNLQSLITQMRVVADHTAGTYSDAVTNNLIVDHMQRLEKYLWKVSSHIS